MGRKKHNHAAAARDRPAAALRSGSDDLEAAQKNQGWFDSKETA